MLLATGIPAGNAPRLTETSTFYRKNSAFFAMKPCHFAGTFSWAKIADTGHAGTHASQSMHVAGSMYICS